MDELTFNITINISKSELNFILENGGTDFESYDSYQCQSLYEKCILTRNENGLYIGTEILYKMLNLIN